MVCIREQQFLLLEEIMKSPLQDGQITMGNIIAKTRQKIRKIYHNTILTGFAGGAADALAL